MVTQRYIPGRGDIVWITLDPKRGHEQRGRRPALILSPKNYNKKSGLALLCPITSKTKNYPFEVPVGDGGVVLVDHVRSVDWKARRTKKKSTADAEVTKRAQKLLTTLITD